MRRNPEFVLSDVAGNHILMPVGSAAINLNGMITINDTGVMIWKELEKDLSFEQLLSAITDRYEVSGETARADLLRFMDVMRSVNGIIE